MVTAPDLLGNLLSCMVAPPRWVNLQTGPWPVEVERMALMCKMLSEIDVSI